MKHKYPVVGVKKALRKSLAPFWGGVLAVMVLALVGAGPGPFNQAIVQAFGGPLNLHEAAAGEVPVKQADGSWAPGAGGGGGIGGSTGSTDNALTRADGTGGATLQAASLTVSDTGILAWLTGLTSPSIQGPSDARFEILAGASRGLRLYGGSSGELELGISGSGTYVNVLPGSVAVLGSASFTGSGTAECSGFKRRVYTYTGGSGAATTLTHSQSGSIICNTGATAETYVNLPTLDGAEDVGLTYTFDCTAASAGSYGLRFTAASGDTITVGTDTSASAGYVRTTIVNSCVTIYAASTSEWRAINGSLGPWEVN